MTNIVKTLKNKCLSESQECNHVMSRVVRRKRIEQKRTLEEVSKGICSPSYLSKIENCLVEADDVYYKALFEKLDLKYETVKSRRSENVISQLLTYYLLNKKNLIEEKVNEIVNDKSYCEVELELIVLFYSIISKTYDEAAHYLKSLESVRNSLDRKEIWFLTYCDALYHFFTCNYITSQEIADVLYETPDLEEEFKCVILNLLLNLSFELDRPEQFFRYYNILEKNDYAQKIATLINHHDMQRLVFMSENNYDAAIKNMKDYELIIDLDNPEINEEYHYFTSRILFNKGLYKETFEMADIPQPSIRLLMMMGACIIMIKDFELYMKFTGILKNNNFKISTDARSRFVEYAKLKAGQYGYFDQYKYLKSILIVSLLDAGLHYYCDLAVKEYLRIAVELGKYKESLGFIMRLQKVRFIN